jgi:hypothetical protein
MTRKAKAILTLSGVGLLLAVGLVAYLLVFSDWPGGMRPTYAAADYDARLTREAATAMPLIAALNRYRDEHAGFPAHAADLISYLVSASPGPLTASIDDILGWRYAQGEKGVSYILSRKLGGTRLCNTITMRQEHAGYLIPVTEALKDS